MQRVSAQHILKRPPPESLDTLTLTFEFAKRVSGVLCGVRATPLFWRVHVFGNRGSAEAIGPTELVLRTIATEPDRQTFQPLNAIRCELEAFADAIEEIAPYPIPVEQMIDTIAALEAIVTSIRTGKAVSVEQNDAVVIT